MFDLATIYSFVESRKNIKSILNANDLEVIKNTKVVFKNASSQRNELMKEIKDQILKYYN